MTERNYEIYYDLMSQSMKEKSDYIIEDLLSTIKPKQKALIIDFGGANGQLLSIIKNMVEFTTSTNLTYIVIEKQEVIDLVEPGFGTDGILFMTLEDFNHDYRNSFVRSYVIFSSVLHELFSFNELLEVSEKYFEPLLRKAKKIYIRDMFFGGSLGELLHVCNYKANEKYHNQYMEYIGCVTVPTHEKIFEFLMKTRYLNHWDQEKKEYYFSVPYDQLFITFAKYGFVTQYIEKYRNNHVIEEIESRMNWCNQFEDITATHIKLIFTNFKEVK